MACKPLMTAAAAVLTLALSACGGASEPVVPQGFGPSQLYDPASNPTGRVLQEEDTDVVFLGAAGAQVWFEVAEAATYGFVLEDEDLDTLSRLEVAGANGLTLAWADAAHRAASAELIPGRYVLRLAANADGAEAAPLFIRFGGGGALLAASAAKRLPINSAEARSLLLQSKACLECNLNGVELAGADLANAVLFGASLQKANLSKANLSKADLREANLGGARLDDAQLPNAKLMHARLGGASLAGAALQQADLTVADLRQANLAGARFDGANLEGANLQGAQTGGASFAGANLIAATWVDGRICIEHSQCH